MNRSYEIADLAQHALALNGEAGNPLAVQELRDYRNYRLD